MAYFLKEKDMPTATLDDLRYSKKRCDFLRNLTSGLGIVVIVLDVLFKIIDLPESIISSSAMRIFAMVLLILTGAGSVFLSVFAKEEKKFFVPAAACIIVYGIISVIAGDVISMVGAFVGIIFLPLATYFCGYNEKLKAIKGYPCFNHHEENRAFEGMTRLQALEICKNGGSIINPDDFFANDKKPVSEENKEIDKSDWLSG